jgi:murein DD-endopeptidase MepM/ murein hydrolase activator NlpD
MSFIMIASGPTSSAGVRTVSMRLLMLCGALVAMLLLALGAAVGYWASTPQSSPSSSPLAQPQDAAPRSLLPFAVEQLGALSARLFKLESQAGQLSDRIRTMNGQAPKPQPAASAHGAGRGGPMLPPRGLHTSFADMEALVLRLAQIERQIASVADAATLQHLALQSLPTRAPLQGAELTSRFGNRDDPLTGRRAFHAGLDFAAAAGTPILAAAAGAVVFAGFRPDYGWTVEIEHGNGLRTRYAHASRLFVKLGALVMQGDTVAAVGSSGRSTGAHLHFEVLRHGEPSDPRRYLAGL